MKKLVFIFLIAAIFAACSSNEKSYTITGTVAEAADGDTVFMQEIINRTPVKVDTAVISAGEFVFTGRQDSVVNRYITYSNGQVQYNVDFFLENGKIKAQIGSNSMIKGTPANDTYQAFKDKLGNLEEEERFIYESLQDTTLTDEQRKQKMTDIDTKEAERKQVIIQTINDNMTNPVGIDLLGRYNFLLGYEEIEPLLAHVPAQYQRNERIMRLNDQISVAKNTALGKKFVDFSMQTPQGKTVSLSDYIGQNKYTLIDFWASWCGPCRAEMPNLVSAYAQYKNNGFEIVGVSLDKSLDAWKNGINALHITWPQMSDLKFWNSQGAALYAVRSIPYTVLVAQDGTIVAKGLHGEGLQSELAKLFK